MAERGTLERAHVRLALIRALATGEHTHGELAKQHGVTRQAVTEFVKRHAARIDQVRAKLDDEFAGRWIADKNVRLAHLEDQILRVLDLIESPEKALSANVGVAEVERVIQTALRNAAEELGQLPSRQTIQHEGGVSVRYELVGIDPEDLT